MERSLGCLPRVTEHGDGTFPVFSDQFAAIPRSEWPERLAEAPDLSAFVDNVKDQNGEGACAANSSSSALEIVRSQNRQPFVDLSAASLYKRVNDGRDQGSTLDRNLREISAVGVLPVTMFPPVGWRNRLPAGWEPEAAKYRLTEWLDLGSFDEFFTALLLGFPVSYGVNWEGGGHAICAVQAIEDRGGDPGCKLLNSWGEDWGDNGYGDMFEGQIANGLAKYGGWAARVAVLPGDDTPTPN